MEKVLNYWEHFQWLINSEGHSHIEVVVKIRGVIDSAAIRSSLTALQQQYFLTNISVGNQESGVFFYTACTAPVPFRSIRRQSCDQWQRECMREMHKPFLHPSPHPLIRVVLLESADAAELLLTFHHGIYDGIACLAFVKQLFGLTQIPVQESIAPRQIDPYFLSELIKEPLAPVIMADVLAHVQWKKTVSSIGSAKNPARKTGVFFREIDREETSKILAVCKAQGLSVNSLFSAATLSAFRKKLIREGTLSLYPLFRLDCAINFRPFFSEDLDQSEIGFYAGTLTLYLDPLADILKLAHQIQCEVNARRNRDLPRLMLAVVNEIVQHPEALEIIQGLSEWDGPYMGISNLGITDIQTQYTDFSIEGLHITGALHAFFRHENNIYLALHTLEGRLFCNFIYPAELVSLPQLTLWLDDFFGSIHCMEFDGCNLSPVFSS